MSIMNAFINDMMNRYHADVEAGLQKALTGILGHEPSPDDLRGRIRKIVGTEVITQYPFAIYYLDDVAFLHVSGPRLDILGQAYWTITPLPGSECHEQGFAQQRTQVPPGTVEQRGSLEADECVFQTRSNRDKG